MRGKVQHVGDYVLVVGITPAYAGKSTPAIRNLGALSGSPPRMRGKVCQRIGEVFDGGITPAYAGKRHRRSPG